MNIQEILKNHKIWLDTNGEKGERADLRGANLREADLRWANLRGADLRWANLREADLRWANLRLADLREADLRGANLRGADLRLANLREADLRLANLREANLRWAYLQGSDLRGADLRGAYLQGANLRGTDLQGVKYDSTTKFFGLQCPEKGSFIGYKKASGYIVTLKIPNDALRSSATTKKCRCSKAEVLSIETLDGESTTIQKVESDHDSNFIYEIGKTVEVLDFDTDRWNECSTGIHFFVDKCEAIAY